ncbi:MAG: hypothetical protein HQL24_02690 [Candidatus Omnitrophica bacterium]|nr:hypothetical protein [Candidatus Omnitrophota bacterium]
MNPLRAQLATVLISSAYKGIEHLDKNSPLVRELKGLDVDKILKEDIQKICNEVSFSEMTRILALIAKLKLGREEESLKAEMKKIAKNLITRIERGSGKLQTPASCREMLFNL